MALKRKVLRLELPRLEGEGLQVEAINRQPLLRADRGRGLYAVEGTVESGLVELLAAKCGMTCAHDNIELLESLDDGRHRLAFESDLVCPSCHLAFIDL